MHDKGMLWLAANRRSDTLATVRDLMAVQLWLAANRRSDTLDEQLLWPERLLWLAANRRSDTLAISTVNSLR